MAPVEDEDEEDQEAAADDDAGHGVGPDGWLDLMDGKIRKRVISEGSGRQPEMKQDVRCSFTVRLASSGSEEGSEDAVLQRYTNCTYRIGEGEAVPMLELSLRHMREGEEAEVFGVANMAWGPSGLRAAAPEEQAIPPDADIRMRVVLHQLLEVSGGVAPPSWNELIQEVTWRKTNGNDHFRRQEFHKASRCYAAGIEVFQGQSYEPPEYIDEKDKPAAKAAAMSLVADCGANLAAVHLELGRPVQAKETAQALLEMCPEHVKGIYRAAKACMILDDFRECEELLRRGFALEPENAALQRVEAELKQKMKRYEAKSKRVAGSIFQGLDYPEPAAAGQGARAAEEEEGWLRWAYKALVAWFQWQVAAILGVGAVLLAALLAVLPKRHWPPALIAFVMGVPVAIGLVLGLGPEDEREGGARRKKKAA